MTEPLLAAAQATMFRPQKVIDANR